ncbi:MAG: alpha-L-fucosidase [Sedimentisphaerales bacterium]|nr:alpha-L-fucosidase [Sedimentisphaerales bacterium]
MKFHDRIRRIVPLSCILTLLSIFSCGSTPTTWQPIPLSPEDTDEQLLIKAAHVLPHPRQLQWQQRELIGFIHFTVNTFTDKEWGEGTESPSIFNPAELDCRQWVKVCKEAGMKMIILTAKHHDGFCLWPSQYTDHTIAASPWRGGKGDVVAELAQACKKEGLELGLYLSPWDRHEPTYGDSPKYNQYYINQLEELLTQYGPVAEVWMDGACGEGPNGKRQEYDWPAYFATVRRLQPDAVIFNGPDVRWVGNEAGYARETEWSPIGVNTLDVLEYKINPQAKDLGSLEAIRKANYILWYPAETDVSIRPGWFYHAAEDDKVKTIEKLLDIYYSSVGRNSLLLLNIPPDRRGLIHEADAQRLRDFGKVIRSTFAENLAKGAKASEQRGPPGFHSAAKIVDGKEDTYWTTQEGISSATIEFDLKQLRTFNVVMLQEPIAQGQHIVAFTVEARQDGQWRQIAQGTTIGYKRLLRMDPVTAQQVRIRINQSRLFAALSNFGLFYQKPIQEILSQ